MDPSKYGPFADVVALACALAATFSVLLLKTLGTTKQWTWLSGDSPPFLVTAGARILAVALMAVTYVTIDSSNYIWFGGAAVICGLLGFLSIARFDRMRRQHVVEIPLVGKDGRQLVAPSGNPMYEHVVIGLERDLNPEAKEAFQAAREARGGLSLVQFMGGYGASRVNDPEALWDRTLLANVSNRLTVSLMLIVLFAVMAIFLGAFAIEAARS